jgi:flagellar protein FliO/FliZ
MGGLLAVLALVLVLAWVLRYVMQVRPGAHGQLRIVGGLSMGPRERVVLVDVAGTQLLLGVSPGRIQTLHVLDEPVPETSRHAMAETPFARQLASVLGRREDAR